MGCAHFIRPPLLGARCLCRGFAFTACGLPPGFVVARFHRCALKTWADELRSLYPPTASRRPFFFQEFRTYELAGDRAARAKYFRLQRRVRYQTVIT